MSNTDFAAFVAELEAKATPDDRVLLEAAREHYSNSLKHVQRRIEARDRANALEQRIVAECPAIYRTNQYGDVKDLDGIGIEAWVAVNTAAMPKVERITILVRALEVWAHTERGNTLTPEPIGLLSEDGIIAYINKVAK